MVQQGNFKCHVSNPSKHNMLLFIFEDDHGWVYEPHGVEPYFWSTSLEGSDILKASGWKPYEMHRVSHHLHKALLKAGHLRRDKL